MSSKTKPARDVRSLYPHAVVRTRDPLASLAGNAWYVYRDGRCSPFSDGPPWWDEPTAARVVIDDAGCYVDANPPALELLGVSLKELRRSRAGDFTPPAFGAEAPWTMQLLRDTGELHSLSMLRSRNDGPDAAVEFRIGDIFAAVFQRTAVRRPPGMKRDEAR